MRVLPSVLRLIDPHTVIACYTVFLVVRAVEADDPQHEDAPLIFCPDHGCELSLGTDVLTEFDFMEEEKPPLLVTQGLFYIYLEFGRGDQ